jgi:hypothetical protein
MPADQADGASPAESAGDGGLQPHDVGEEVVRPQAPRFMSALVVIGEDAHASLQAGPTCAVIAVMASR